MDSKERKRDDVQGTPESADKPRKKALAEASERSPADKVPHRSRTRTAGDTAHKRTEKAVPTRKRAADGEKPRSRKAASKPARPAQQDERTPKRAPRAQKHEGSDAGYHPYRKANERRKRTRRSALATFFSAQNPIVRSIDDMRARAALQRMDPQRLKKKRRADTPAVIYTQPLPFNRDRLLVQLLTVLAIVLAVVLGLSVFFKVRVITVSGAEVYGAWTVREASGISEGDSLLTFGRARAAGKITAQLPYVKSARIGIKLPDTVNIEIVEESVVYAIKSSDGVWWLMDSAGKVVEQSTSGAASNYTQVLGVTLDAPVVNEQAVAYTQTASTDETDASETTATTEATVSLSITASQRLNTALEILQALEDNDIVGSAASVDVTRMNDIVLWYGTQYQVNLGDNGNLSYKISCMNDAILQLSDYQSGVLDISFTTWPDQVVYTPFD